VLVQFRWRADLFEPSHIDDREEIGHLHRFLLVMSDEDSGDVDLVVEAAKPRP
jgi:hypothetical protein